MSSKCLVFKMTERSRRIEYLGWLPKGRGSEGASKEDGLIRFITITMDREKADILEINDLKIN